MPAKYSVVQYLPDPISGEKLNIGVVIWDRSAVRAKFLSNWARARAFGGEDVRFLQDFASDFAKLAKSGQQELFQTDGIDAPTVEKMIGRFQQSIQFSEARGSLEDAEKLVEQLAHRFLREAPLRARRGRTRQTAVRIAYQYVLDAVNKQRPSDADHFVHRRAELRGKLESHRFDIVMKNGHDVAAVNALSFEVRDTIDLNREVDSIAWALDDVRKRQPNLPLALYLLPGGARTKLLVDRAEALCKALNADVFRTESTLGKWAGEKATAFAA